MTLNLLSDNFLFAEGLRWHDGALWLSDFLTRRVYSISPNGETVVRAFVPGQPSGLGFDQDGSPLVVSMFDKKLLRITPGGLAIAAQLADCAAAGPCNDMVVSKAGDAYIGCFGYEMWFEHPPAQTQGTLIKVGANGGVKIVARDLATPNGMAFLPGEAHLVVAETSGCRLTVFEVAADGSLSGRRTFADLGGRQPDGICVDRNGDVWVACLDHSEFILVRDGGEILMSVPTDGLAITCALGGPSGHTLFCATASIDSPEDFFMGRAKSAIAYCEVGTPSQNLEWF